MINIFHTSFGIYFIFLRNIKKVTKSADYITDNDFANEKHPRENGTKMQPECVFQCIAEGVGGLRQKLKI